MKVIWLPQAKKQLRQTAQYIRQEFGARYRDDFMDEVHHASTLIGQNAHLGKAEPLLANYPVLYRSLVVNRLNKIVYFTNNDHIEVVAFWDVRREPKKLAEQVKE